MYQRLAPSAVGKFIAHGRGHRWSVDNSLLKSHRAAYHARTAMNDEIGLLKQKWLATGSWQDEQEFLWARVQCGELPHVDVDLGGDMPDGFAVVLRRPTGVAYMNQCTGTLCDHRIVEGVLVPVGLWKWEADGKREVKIEPFIEVFHDGKYCRNDWVGRQLPAERLETLRKLVQDVPYAQLLWHVGDRPYRFRLDESRIDEIAEAWIPVDTVDGPGVLLYRNCD